MIIRINKSKIRKPTSRAFNKFRLTEIYEKSSNHKDKIINEYNYLISLPDSLKNFYPSIQKDSLVVNNEKASYEIEKINGQDLSNLYLSNKVTEQISNKLFNFLDDWLSNVENDDFVSNSIFIIEKTKFRYSLLDKNGYLKDLEIISNYLNLPSPEKMYKI